MSGQFLSRTHAGGDGKGSTSIGPGTINVVQGVADDHDVVRLDRLARFGGVLRHRHQGKLTPMRSINAPYGNGKRIKIEPRRFDFQPAGFRIVTGQKTEARVSFLQQRLNELGHAGKCRHRWMAGKSPLEGRKIGRPKRIVVRCIRLIG